MLTATGNGERDGKPVTIVVFGLSHMNLKLLKEGKPIKVSGERCGLDPSVNAAALEFLIFAGETEQSMQRELAEMVGPDTQVNIDPRLKN